MFLVVLPVHTSFPTSSYVVYIRMRINKSFQFSLFSSPHLRDLFNILIIHPCIEFSVDVTHTCLIEYSSEYPAQHYMCICAVSIIQLRSITDIPFRNSRSQRQFPPFLDQIISFRNRRKILCCHRLPRFGII